MHQQKWKGPERIFSPKQAPLSFKRHALPIRRPVPFLAPIVCDLVMLEIIKQHSMDTNSKRCWGSLQNKDTEVVRKVVRAPHFKPKRADIKKPSAEAALGSFGLFLPMTHSLCPPSESSRRTSKMISAAGQQGHLELRQRNKMPSSPLKPKYHIYCLQLLKLRFYQIDDSRFSRCVLKETIWTLPGEPWALSFCDISFS